MERLRKFLLLPLFMLNSFAFADATAVSLPFMNGGITAQLSWLQEPSTGRAAVLKVEWQSHGQPAEPPAAFTVDIAMAMEGMNYPAVPRPQPLVGSSGRHIPGVYSVQPLYFSMSGAWIVSVHLHDDRIETQSWSVTIP